MAEICIIDYKSGGNIFSLQNSLSKIGVSSYLSSEPNEIDKANKIIFPGVGSFSAAMQKLKELGLVDVIKKKALSGIPFMGICVGMQVLFQSSTEGLGISEKGLGIIPGNLDKFQIEGLKVPHMGWNEVQVNSNENPLFKNLKSNQFYFVHSYRVKAEKITGYQCFTTNYGEGFISHVWNGENLFACQFHPEKSGETGLELISNFAGL